MGRLSRRGEAEAGAGGEGGRRPAGEERERHHQPGKRQCFTPTFAEGHLTGPTRVNTLCLGTSRAEASRGRAEAKGERFGTREGEPGTSEGGTGEQQEENKQHGIQTEHPDARGGGSEEGTPALRSSKR